MLLLASSILLILSPLSACHQFYIAPSPILCPGGQDAANQHCLTIEQFASSADLTLGSNVILEWLLATTPWNLSYSLQKMSQIW